MGGQQDMRYMGALRDKIPVTYRTMWIGSIAIAGIPGLAGFFSKDEILWQAFSSPHGSTVLWAVGFTTAAMTAFYMWRMMYMTFYGKSRVAPEVHVHESPLSMTGVLGVLAAGSVLAGWLGVPKLWSMFGEGFRTFETWLEPVFESGAVHEVEHSASTEWTLMLLSIAVAVAGILVAKYFYITKPQIPEDIAAAAPGLYRTLSNKWYLDEIYDFVFVNGLCKGGGLLMGAFDRNVVDGGVNGAGWFTRLAATVSGWWDTWIIDGAVRLGSFLVKMLSYPVCLLQTGRVQGYAFFVIVGVLVFFGYYIVR
jgi:NADH-quinone oxidoreductase subunit L